MDPSNGAEIGGTMSKKKPRSRKAKAPSFPFPIEALNRGRPARNLPEDVSFVEDWLAVAGARAAECAGRDVIKPTDFHELEPGKDGRRCIEVPGSQEGGVALARSARDRLSDFFRVVHSDSRWATARSHPEIHTLAEAAFFAQHALEAVLAAFELANKSPEPSRAEKRWLEDAVKTAAEVVERLGQSERFKALLPVLEAGRSRGGQRTGKKLRRKAGKKSAQVVDRWNEMEKRGYPERHNRASVIAKEKEFSPRSVRRWLEAAGLGK
jgi:hypothetical protein